MQALPVRTLRTQRITPLKNGTIDLNNALTRRASSGLIAPGI